MMRVRLRKMHVTKHVTMAAALAAALLGASTASATDAPRAAQARQAPAVTSDAPAAAEGPRIDRTRPGRRQPAFGLRRLTPAPTQAQPAPNRPM